MKVLFAVHDEKVSSSIVKKYQKDYKEIISYKNVYYFNAILKEIQRDKTYDRIVIDEELEEFTSTSYEERDKFIFDTLDNITDEASSTSGNDIPIILICSERRVKSEEILVKLFGIGIYNAIIGNDRSTDEVCRLIKKPRSKKEAKVYYRIDVEDVSYKPENENDVSEEEMQHILSYFKRLGKNEEKYIEVFRNIVSQYNDNQMKIIIAILPLHVRSVLEEASPEYQKIVSRNGGHIVISKPKYEENRTSGTSEKLLDTSKTGNKLGRPIVVPSKLDKNLIKKVSIKKPTIPTPIIEEDFEDVEEDKVIEQDVQPKPKRRGRPPKKVQENNEEIEQPKPKRRGRPPKKKVEEEKQEEINEFDDILSEIETESEPTLPGFEDIEEDDDVENVLPGFDDEEDMEEEIDDTETMLPGFDDEDDNYDYNDDTDTMLPGVEEEIQYTSPEPENIDTARNYTRSSAVQNYNQNYEHDFTEYDNNLLAGDKKVIAFVGTSKNGTSFIVNNMAKILSDSGINTAILDATQNKNAYYIYTQNDESLRQQAARSINNLIRGNAGGVQVNNNLTVYSEIPNQESNIENVGPILETLSRSHSAILIDCDFNTPREYFAKVQEIYLVQSMDVLTIQPLTAFLKELKTNGILNENKIKIVINKSMRLKAVTPKNIVGGMAFYNDPEMSFMTELFDRNTKVPIEIPFDVEVYARYLDQIVDCEISINKYPKEMQSILKKLAMIIYPLLPAKKTKEKAQKGYKYSTNEYSNGFSNSVNNTLNNMKKKY